MLGVVGDRGAGQLQHVRRVVAHQVVQAAVVVAVPALAVQPQELVEPDLGLVAVADAELQDVQLFRERAALASRSQLSSSAEMISRTPARADTDLASYIEARRRARGESAPPAPPPPSESRAKPARAQEDPNARANRLAAANLGLDRKPQFGADTRRGGGVFTIQKMAYDYAEFIFYGWNKDIKRDTQQLIEVRKGNNSDIRLAVVRRMISIIREHEQGDFVSKSPAPQPQGHALGAAAG